MGHWLLKRRTTALWLALLVTGFTTLLALNARSSDLRDEIMAEIKNATQRGEVSMEISDVVKKAILSDPGDPPVEILMHNGFKEEIIRRLDARFLETKNADYYRVFSDVIIRPNWYSYWECTIYLLYEEDQPVDVMAHIHLTGL